MPVAVFVNLQNRRKQLLGRQRLNRELHRLRARIETVIAHGTRSARASAGKQLGCRLIVESHLKPRKTIHAAYMGCKAAKSKTSFALLLTRFFSAVGRILPLI
jgi:hypothetical protein